MVTNKLVLTGRDIIRGYTTKTNLSSSQLYEVTPWQMIPLEEKTPEWKQWVADYFEWVGIKQVKDNFFKTLKNRFLAAGILEKSDYSTETGEFSYLAGVKLPEELCEPFKRNYPLIPPFIKVLDGEFIKRGVKMHVSCIDRNTINEKIQYKTDQVNNILHQLRESSKIEALKKIGIYAVSDDELRNASDEQVKMLTDINSKYMSEMKAMNDLYEAESKYKTYRHIFEQFGQHVISQDYAKHSMSEIEREGFIETLCNSKILMHLDMGEDSYVPEIIDNANAFYHKSHSIKYYSKGDYIGWFTDYSIGDIINKYGRILTPEQHGKLQELSMKFTSMLPNGGVFNVEHERGFPGATYDASKPYPLGKTNVPYNDLLVREQMLQSVTNTHLTTEQLLGVVAGKTVGLYTPKLFRLMTLYWRSQKKVGWLTKKDRSGNIVFTGWVDENFKVTEKPVYDKRLVQNETKENLVYGEHIDWEWVDEWRRILKINNNVDHSFWKTQSHGFEPIYIDGDPCRFQFTGTSESPYGAEPPLEGVEFKLKQVRPVPFVELLAPSAILYNMALNKVPDIIYNDPGKVLAINKNTVTNNRPGLESMDPIDNFQTNLMENKIIEYTIDREIQKEIGNTPIVPQVIDYSKVLEGISYLRLGDEIWRHAGKLIGISEQRLAQAKASETATTTMNNINYSETQTEPLFHQYISEFLPRFYTKMLDAAQYYTTIKGSDSVGYQTSDGENIFIEVENMERVARQWNITVSSNIKDGDINNALREMLLKNNNKEASLYKMAEAIAAEAPSDKIEILREAEVLVEQRLNKEYEREIEKNKQIEEAQQAAEQRRQQFELKKLKMTLDSQERQSEIRALGGLQSDNNKDGALDAKQNIEAFFKQGSINIQNDQFSKKLDFEKRKHEDDISLKKEDMANKVLIEQKKLAASIANQNKNDDKSLNRRISKSQNVS